MAINLKRAVFLDKDGTLVRDVPYNVDPARIQLLPGVALGLGLLQQAGFELIVASNQPGVALGYFPEAALRGVEARLDEFFSRSGARLAGFYYCPHAKGNCACRKPRPGLLLRAARERGIDLKHSWFIGDILDDIEAGNRAGCKTILIDNGNETEWKRSPERQPFAITSDFSQAARTITAMPSDALEGPSSCVKGNG